MADSAFLTNAAARTHLDCGTMRRIQDRPVRGTGAGVGFVDQVLFDEPETVRTQAARAAEQSFRALAFSGSSTA